MEVPSFCWFCSENLPCAGIKDKNSVDSCTEVPVNQFNILWKHLCYVEGRDFESFLVSPPVCLQCEEIAKRIIKLLTLLDSETIKFQKLLAGRVKDERKSGVEQRQPNNFDYDDDDERFDPDDGNFPDNLGSAAPSEEDSQRRHKRRRKRKIVVICEENFADESVDSSSDVDYKGPARKTPKTERNVNVVKAACDLCCERVSRDEMEEHVRYHVGDFALKCPNPRCNQYFCTIIKFKEHSYRLSTRCKPFFNKSHAYETCDLCGYEASLQALRNHMQMVHETGEEKPHPCPVQGCTERFCHRESVYFHISRKHSAPHNNRRFVASGNTQKCPECSEILQTEHIVKHYEDSHGVPQESVKSCQLCIFRGMNYEQLWKHLWVHFRNGAIVPCHLCPEQINFSRLADLRKHYFDKHQIGETFLCDQCTKEFNSQLGLSLHRKKFHTGKGDLHPKKKLLCDQCPESAPRAFRCQKALMSHKVFAHGAEPWKCSSCQMTFTSYKAFQIHEKTHQNVAVKEYICDIGDCRHVCCNKADLERHKASVKHVGRTNAFICPDCGMGFNSKSICSHHMRTVHSEVRAYVCESCGQAFKGPQSLKRHMLVHTKSMPEECHICHKRFRQKHHVKIHMKTHE